MKFLIITFLLSLTSIAMATEPTTLEAHRWQHRILVIPEPSKSKLAKLKQNKAHLEERDIVTIITCAKDPTPMAQEVATRFEFTAASKEILLIGKDGRTTVRWPLDEFTFEKLFTRIDAMPMRQREMRERK